MKDDNDDKESETQESEMQKLKLQELETQVLKNEEERFAVGTDIKAVPGDYKVRGFPFAWFSDRESAEDYLRKKRIEIERVYIIELEPSP